MKKTVGLMLLILMLTGCANAREQIDRALALRTRLLQGEGCSFTAGITADYGDVLHSFTLECRGDGQGNLAFTVVEPETIAGITGSISSEAGKLTFDETALDFPLLADGQVTPVSAPWLLLKTLRGGYLTGAGEEGELLRLAIDDSYEEDALHLDIWLDPEDRPVQADILYDGRRILSLTVTDFEIL